MPGNMFHHKTVRRLNGCLFNFKVQIIRLEIFDLYRLLHYLNNELDFLTREIQHSLPPYIRDSIFTHHFHSFDNFKHRIFRTHFNKLRGLLNQKRNQRISSVKNISYTYFPNVNKFCYNKFTATNDEAVDSHINISVSPENFDINKSNTSLEQVNKKWFINLSDKVIPHEVSMLLQFGDRFCLPNSINKKTAIHEFIKDIESNMKYHNSDKPQYAILLFHNFTNI